MVRSLVRLWWFFPALMLLAACGRTSDNSKVIAKIGKAKITENYFVAALKAKRRSADYKESDKDKNIDFLNTLVESQVLALAAKDAGLTNDASLSRRLKSLRKRIINQKYQEVYLENYGGVAKEKLEKFYESNKDEFKDDSGVVQPFVDAVKKVVDKYLIKNADLDSFFQENKVQYAKIKDGDTTFTTLDENREKVEKSYLRKYKRNLVQNLKPNLFEKYNVEIHKPQSVVKDEDLKAFYESNKDKYMSNETYEIYHIELDTEEGLKDKIKNLGTLDDFKAAAKESSQNNWTKDKGGYVGFVKNAHCLPYGIGMFPRLFPILDSLIGTSAELKKTRPLNNPQSNKWHSFAVIKKVDRTQKPYDRVAALVKSNYFSEKGEAIPPDALLASYDKGGKVTEQDVLHLREEIPPHYQQRYTRSQLVDFIVLWDLSEKEAGEVGLLKDLSMQATLDMESQKYWSKVYQDSVMKDTYGLDSATLAATFEANREYFMPGNDKASYQPQMNRSIAIFLSLDKNAIEMEYNIHPDKYMKDSTLLPFEEAKYKIFQNLRRKNQRKPRENNVLELREKYGVQILDTLFIVQKPENSLDEFKKAQDLHTERKLNDALKQYKSIMEHFPESHTLIDSVLMGMAQVYVELEKYNDALAEYRRLLYLYPESPNNYKAQFMIGFIYAENLKKDGLAIKAFKVLLDKYPKCDLADDADWMIRNIESGGALMPVLEDS